MDVHFEAFHGGEWTTSQWDGPNMTTNWRLEVFLLKNTLPVFEVKITHISFYHRVAAKKYVVTAIGRVAFEAAQTFNRLTFAVKLSWTEKPSTPPAFIGQGFNTEWNLTSVNTSRLSHGFWDNNFLRKPRRSAKWRALSNAHCLLVRSGGSHQHLTRGGKRSQWFLLHWATPVKKGLVCSCFSRCMSGGFAAGNNYPWKRTWATGEQCRSLTRTIAMRNKGGPRHFRHNNELALQPERAIKQIYWIRFPGWTVAIMNLSLCPRLFLERS